MRIIKLLAAIFCLLISVSAAARQFKTDHIAPLVFSALALIPLLFIRPQWFRLSCLIPLIGVGLILIDAYVLRHRIAVEYRCWNPLWDITSIREIISSPSGDTTVYLINSSFTDSSYWIYLSTGGLFPKHGYLTHTSSDMYRRNLVIGWKDQWFYIGERLISFAYNEVSNEVLSYSGWNPRLGSTDRSLEAFDQDIRQKIDIVPSQ
ncbi:hypothetical protein FEM03_04875 [Phragmitibacter flavus]|uniref:Uncharacterized protein n=1 Tax=Phragmitibacter flavus TaxID=2576071 RepID=A0A5R8KIE9_9BACT|nr:hypothetical protein [Phragmitibacter flavus]TLD72062.1 hypothetical protein FEM03_04875 [Phragmitibacter flavus]